MTTQPDIPFSGYEYPHDHWCKLPHALIDQLAVISTVAELKVLLYVLRHTWGFQDYDAGRRITLDEFCHGRKRSDGTRLDGGTGLSPSAVKDGVRAAVEHGFLIRESDGRDAARSSHIYRLRRRADEATTPDGLAEQDIGISLNPTGEDQPGTPVDGPGYRSSACSNVPGYRTPAPDDGSGCRTSVARVLNLSMRSGKETLKESDAAAERNNLPSEAAPQTGPLLRDERLVGRDPDAQIANRAGGSPPASERRLPSGTVRGGGGEFERRGAAVDDWEANRFLQVWQVKHPAAPLADIIELGQALEKRIGMRPDWADKSEVVSWLAGLEKALRAAEGDAELVVETALDMREEGLAIPEPYSLVGMVRDAAARKRVPDNRGPAIHWLN